MWPDINQQTSIGFNSDEISTKSNICLSLYQSEPYIYHSVLIALVADTFMSMVRKNKDKVRCEDDGNHAFNVFMVLIVSAHT